MQVSLGILPRMSPSLEKNSTPHAVSPTSQPVTTLCEAIAYLDGLINRERLPQFAYPRLGLTAIQKLLERLGNPQHGLCVLHIAGSKGKGSTALLAEAIFTEAGYRVGTFTSPHLETWTERFRLEGDDIQECQLVEAVEVLRPHLDELRMQENPPSFFDAVTAIALWLFAQAKVDLAILEVGLGGRLDSTNVVEPALTCITSIELEHTDKLGSDLASIAREKAGILKAGCPVIVGALATEALQVVEARAAEFETVSPQAGGGVAASVVPEGDARVLVLRFGHEFGSDMILCQKNIQRFRFWYGELAFEREIAWLGAHQVHNAALALMTAMLLPGFDTERLVAASTRAFLQLRLPGRIEVVQRDLCGTPQIVIDSAHTQMSARTLIDSLKCYQYIRRELVFSVSRDKNIVQILRELVPHFDHIVVTCAEPSRSLAPEFLAREVQNISDHISVSVIPNPQDAVRAATKRISSRTLLCVAGSVYLAGIARKILVKDV